MSSEGYVPQEMPQYEAVIRVVVYTSMCLTVEWIFRTLCFWLVGPI